MKKYTFKEVQDILGISKGTFYNRLNKFEHILEDHISLTDKKKCIDEQGIEIIKNNSIENFEKVQDDVTEIDNKKESELLKQKIQLQKNEIESLKAQLIVRGEQLIDKNAYIDKLEEHKNRYIDNIEKELEHKNIQISNLDSNLKDLSENLNVAHRLNENNQILLKNAQQLQLQENNNRKKNIFSFFKNSNKDT